MKIQNWLTVKNNRTARLTKNKPAIEWNEVTMLLNIELPDSLFQRPQLKANIKIEGEVNHEFDYAMTSNIKEALQQIPNVHLLKVDVENIIPEKDEKTDQSRTKAPLSEEQSSSSLLPKTKVLECVD